MCVSSIKVANKVVSSIVVVSIKVVSSNKVHVVVLILSVEHGNISATKSGPRGMWKDGKSKDELEKSCWGSLA